MVPKVVGEVMRCSGRIHGLNPSSVLIFTEFIKNYFVSPFMAGTVLVTANRAAFISLAFSFLTLCPPAQS